ncbi:17135_t:CDS:2 [Racocetra persica]|uniref:17135_t:CDS:1 n=1 Tax=Racocetra persica TaxID=160502 RepID=A0ACA9NC59_9GLOM|nr:17135_t:CDS:2 [Racocetra persica]
MSDYYFYGDGNPLSKQIGCVYLTQLVQGVEDYLDGSSIMVADLKNGHAYGNSTKIRMVLNFESILIPGRESEYCEWSAFRKILGNQIGCDLTSCAEILNVSSY